MDGSMIGLDNKVGYPCADTTKSDNRNAFLCYSAPPLDCFRQLVAKNIERIRSRSGLSRRCGSTKEQRVYLLDVVVQRFPSILILAAFQLDRKNET